LYTGSLNRLKPGQRAYLNKERKREKFSIRKKEMEKKRSTAKSGKALARGGISQAPKKDAVSSL
jgi:hypothetical protein